MLVMHHNGSAALKVVFNGHEEGKMLLVGNKKSFSEDEMLSDVKKNGGRM